MKNNPLPQGFFDPIIEKAKKELNPSRILLFGSFARADARDNSDIDLAFEFNANENSWVRFKLWVEEEFDSLREFDLIDLKKIDASFLKVIQTEGIVIYERED